MNGAPAVGDASAGAIPRPWPLARLLGIASGSLALAAMWAAYNAFMPLLLAEFVPSRGVRGAIMGLDNVFALLLIPLVGAWSDRLESPWGRRLPFLMVGVPIAAAAFAALPFAAATLPTLLLVDIVFLAAVTLIRAPLIASMPDHVAPERRSAANAVVTLTAAVGGAIMLIAVAPTFDRHPAIAFAVGGALALATLPIVMRSVQRRPPFVDANAAGDEAPSLRVALADTRATLSGEHAGVRWPLLGLLLAFFGFGAFEAQFSVAATEAFALSGGEAGRLLGFASAAFVLAAWPVGMLMRWVGEARGMSVGAALLAVAVLGVAWMPGRTAALLAAGVGWALVLVPAYPLIVAMGGRRGVGRFTGAYYMAGSTAAILAPGLAGMAMDAFGAGALFAVSAAAFVAATVVFARVSASDVHVPPESG